MAGTDKLLLCGHVFHSSCLGTWTHSSNIIHLTEEGDEICTELARAKNCSSCNAALQTKKLYSNYSNYNTKIHFEGKSIADTTICIHKRKKNTEQSERRGKKAQQKLAEMIRRD